MSTVSSGPTRRSLLAASAAGGAIGAALFADAGFAETPVSGGGSAIRPFHVSVPGAAIADMRRRIAMTRWPDRETVKDQSQGVPLAKLQPLVQYWGTGYDWRKSEAKLNALPQFVTTIDGLDIQFAHIRSRHPNALP